MNVKLLKISLIILITILSSCREDGSNSARGEHSIENELLLTPIHYDYENLKLTLNASISDSISSGFWRWDYMSADKGRPDSTGIDYYVNYEQPSFSYNGEETLPALSIKTNKNKIVEFSVTVIFNLIDHKHESIKNLLDSLTRFDLLRNAKIKQSIIEKGIYKSSNATFEETIELKVSQEEYGYDEIVYEIKNKAKGTH